MPVDPGGRESAATSGTEGGLFAPVPLWARGRKGRRGGRATSDPAMDAGEATPAGLAEPVDPAYETQPADVGVETPARTRRDPPIGGLILAAAALAVIGAAGWFVSRPNERGVPQLTPGAPTASSSVAYAAPRETGAAAPAAPQARPPATSKTPREDAAGRAPPERRSTTPAARSKPSADVTSRVRPAPSASESGANASATVAPTITPPTPGSPSTDPMTVNPAPTARPGPVESPPTVGSPPTRPAPTPDAGTTP